MSGISAMRLIEFATPEQVAVVQTSLNALTTQVGNLSPANVIQNDEFTAAAVRDLLKTVDGSGSGIDADLVRGQSLNIQNGYLITPNRPAFSVCAESARVAVNNSDVYKGELETLVNVGNCFDLNNGRFTAPVDGLYSFDFQILLSTGNLIAAWGNMVFRVNGADIGGKAHLSYDIARAYESISNAITLTLSQGDYVEAYIDVTGGAEQHSGNFSNFNGHLIG